MPTDTPPLRVRTPGDLAAVAPHLLGFPPVESLVLIALTGPRRRVGLTLRIDLVDGERLVGQVVQALSSTGATACALLVFTGVTCSSGHPSSALVDEVEAALAARGTQVVEALIVRDGTWWSYRCAESCCPPSGTPVDATSPVAIAVASEHAYEGRVLMGSREELARSLQPDLPLGRALVRRLQAQAHDALDDAAAALGGERLVRAETARWRLALDAWPAWPGPGDTAALAIGLHLVPVRDEVASWGPVRGDTLLGLVGQLARSVVPPDDAPLLTLLAWVAYAGGDGATATIALQRALATDPSYRMAGLLRAAVDGLLPPAQVRSAMSARPAPSAPAGRRRRARR